MKMFDQFPKIRPALPKAYQKIYHGHYRDNREGNSTAASLSKRMESWMHQRVAADVRNQTANNETLEIGAGNLNHLGYEPRVSPYDVVEPYAQLLVSSIEKCRVRHIYKNISQISSSQNYDRIISIACFEHVTNLPQLVARACRLLKRDGQMRIAIPNEGTFLWRWGTMVTGHEFRRRYGLDYRLLMQHEHVNTANEIEQVLNFFFAKTNCKVFGVSKSTAFYRFYTSTQPIMENVNDYLKGKEGRRYG